MIMMMMIRALETGDRTRSPLLATVITEANTIVGLYLYSVFTIPMFLTTNSLSIVYTFS